MLVVRGGCGQVAHRVKEVQRDRQKEEQTTRMANGEKANRGDGGKRYFLYSS